MNLQEFVAQRKKELDEFQAYNERKFAELGEAWMPAEQNLSEWYEQEDAYVENQREFGQCD